MPDQNRKKPIEMYPEDSTVKFLISMFAGCDPVARARELGITLENDTFQMTLFGSPYRITWPDGIITSEDPDGIAMYRGGARTLLLRWLIGGKLLPSTGKFRTFGELPWGSGYAQVFENRCIKRAANKFGTNLTLFRKASVSLSGRALTHSDASFEYTMTGGYDLRIFVWEGDDAFPPNAQILFSDNFAAGFTAEDCIVSVETLLSALSDRMLKITEDPDSYADVDPDNGFSII